MEDVLLCEVPEVETFLLYLVEIATTLARGGRSRGGSVGRDVLNGSLRCGVLLEVGGDDVQLGCVIGDVVCARGLRSEERGVGMRLVDEVKTLPRRR